MIMKARKKPVEVEVIQLKMVSSRSYRKCKEFVGETMARDHIRKCWKFPIKDTDPIPAVIPEGVK